MAGSSGAKDSVTRQAAKWRKLFEERKSWVRIQNLVSISKDYHQAIQKGGANQQQLWKDLVHATGDRSTAKKVAALREFSDKLIKNAVKHMQREDNGATDSSSTPSEKQGTRGPDGKRVRRARGLSVTHLLVLTLIKDQKIRESAFAKCLYESWSLDKLRANVKSFGSRKDSAPKMRPLRLAYATLKQAGELRQLLIELNNPDFGIAAKVIRKRDRDSAIQNCELAMQELNAVKDSLDGAVTALKLLHGGLKGLTASENSAVSSTEKVDVGPKKRSTKKE